MKKVIILLYVLFILNLVNSQTIDWASSITSFGNDKGVSLVYDKNENCIYTLINFYQGPIIKGTEIKTTALVKYSLDGDVIWAKDVTGNGKSLTIDNQGNIFICGMFSDSIILDSIKLISNGFEDIYFAKFSNEGKCLWAFSAGGPQTDEASGITVDSKGNVTISAFMGMQAKVNGSVVNNLGNGILLIQYSNSGVYKWAIQEGYNNRPMALTSDADGNLLVGGFFSFGSNFGGTTNIPGGGGFVAKYDTIGNFKWAVPLYSLNAMVLGVSVDESNNVYATGYFKDSLKCQDSIKVSLSFKDIFALKIDNEGNLKWLIQSGYFDEDIALCGTINNNYYTIAGYWGINYPANTALFIQGFDVQNGNKTMLWICDSTNTKQINAIISDSNGNLYFTGEFKEKMKLSNNELNAYSSSDLDYFIAKMTPLYSRLSNLTTSMFSLYPNPAKDYIYVKLPNSNKSKAIIITDMNGRIVLQRKIDMSESSVSIDIKSLINGVYRTIIYDNDGISGYSLLIKQ